MIFDRIFDQFKIVKNLIKSLQWVLLSMSLNIAFGISMKYLLAF